VRYAPTSFLLTLQVKLSIGVKIDIDSVCTRNIVGLWVTVFGLVEQEKHLRQPGQPTIVRTAKMITQQVLCLSMFSNLYDCSQWFAPNHTPPSAQPAHKPPTLRIPAYDVAAGIPEIARPLSCEFVELDIDSFVDALI